MSQSSFAIKGVRLNLFGILAGLVITVGILGPWLWRGYDSWSDFDQVAREPEIHYHTVHIVSPLSISVFKDGKLETAVWFFSPECSACGILLLVAAALSIFQFRRRWANLTPPLLCFASSLLFFLSLGRGVGLGSRTFLDWGFKVTLFGMAISVLSCLIGITGSDG